MELTTRRANLKEPCREDRELIDRCRKGDRGALGTVLGAHAREVERVILRIMGPGSEIEGLLQDTLLAAIDAFSRYRAEASVKTWLTRIAVHTVYQYLRKPERKRRSLRLLVDDHEPVDHAPLPDRQAELQQQIHCLYGHLNAIAPKKRVAFILHVFEGRPIAEVAAMVGATKTATKSRVFWARRALLARVRKDPVLKALLQEPRAEGGE